METPSSAASNSDSTDESEPEILIPSPGEFHIETLEKDAYRKFCLARLRNFVNLRRLPAEESPDEALLHRRILERAVYSAFRDCVAAGAGKDARQILSREAAPAA